MKKVGIIGCGWLGFPLGKHLLKAGFYVNGTTSDTSKAKLFEQNELHHFEFLLGTSLNLSFFKNLEYLIISLPVSSKNSFDLYSNLAEQIRVNKEERTNVIFTSSISVYGNYEGEISEENTIALNKESVNYRFEEILQSYFRNQLTVLRLAGLISEDRHPVFHLAGRTNIQNGNAFINLVHREDVIRSISSIIANNSFGEVYNCVFPLHPTKSDYYTSEAEFRKLELPHFIDGKEIGKIIDGSKIMNKLNNSYQYPILGVL